MSALRFARLGRAWHLEIDDAESLRQVLTLDDALWIATSAPIATLHGDPGLLSQLDPDHDGRIGLRDVKDAIRWTFDQLSQPGEVKPAPGPLVLAAIKDPALRASAQTVLARAGAANANAVTLDQVRKVHAEEEAKGLATADRVLPAAAGEDEALRAYVLHAIDVTGGAPHPSGEPALSAETLATFRADLVAWTDWVERGRLVTPDAVTEVNPLGERTPAAAAAIAVVATKVDAWFTLADAAAVDPAVAERAWPRIELGEGKVLLDAGEVAALLVQAPLARPAVDGRLRRDIALNPAWAAAVHALFDAAAVPLGFGEDGLDRAAWGALRARLAPYEAWVAGRPRDAAKGRDDALMAAHLASTELPSRVEALLEQSKESAAIVAGFDSVERLVLFTSSLVTFTSSFVSCTDLFRDGRQPMFNMGELIADGRRFKLAIRVPDKTRSVAFAGLSSTFLVYANVGRQAGAWDYEVVVPVTAGERGTLIEGAFCAFIDRDGNELLAQINKVMRNPISIMEAIFAPLAAIQGAVEGWLERRQAAAEAELTAKASEAATSAAAAGVDQASTVGATAISAAQAGAPATPPAAAAAAKAPAASPGMNAAALTAMFTGGSIAIAALGSAFALMGGFISSLSPLGLVGVAVGVASAFVVPTATLAWVKLRRRDVAALLEGSGWGVNHRLRIERPVAALITERPELPDGARTSGKDAGDGPLPSILSTLAVLFVLFALVWAWRAELASALHLELGPFSPTAVEVAPPDAPVPAPEAAPPAAAAPEAAPAPADAG